MVLLSQLYSRLSASRLSAESREAAPGPPRVVRSRGFWVWATNKTVVLDYLAPAVAGDTSAAANKPVRRAPPQQATYMGTSLIRKRTIPKFLP